MITESLLHIGERIRLIKPYLWYPVGREGTITHIYHFDRPTYHPAYRVQFDGRASDDIIYDDVFEFIAPPHISQA
jgi:hypothetical protein